MKADDTPRLLPMPASSDSDRMTRRALRLAERQTELLAEALGLLVRPKKGWYLLPDAPKD